MAPVPKRRRGKISSSVLDEKKVYSWRQRTEELTSDFEKDFTSTSVSHSQDVSSLSSRHAPLVLEDSGDVEERRKRVGEEERPSKEILQTEWKPENTGREHNEGGKTESCKDFLVEVSGVNAFENSGHSKTKRDDVKIPELGEPKFLSPGTPTKLQSEGGVTGSNFDVPPSPGNVKPRPERVKFLHRMIQNGDTISMTRVKEEGAH